MQKVWRKIGGKNLTVILQTIKGREITRTEYDDWLPAMNDGQFIKLEDKQVIVAIFQKGGKFDV